MPVKFAKGGVLKTNQLDRLLSMVDFVRKDVRHGDYRASKHQNYSLAQKAAVFAMTHGMGAGNDLASEITRIQDEYRHPLYHQGRISVFPVEAVLGLARRVLDAAVRTIRAPAPPQ